MGPSFAQLLVKNWSGQVRSRSYDVIKGTTFGKISAKSWVNSTWRGTIDLNGDSWCDWCCCFLNNRMWFERGANAWILRASRTRSVCCIIPRLCAPKGWLRWPSYKRRKWIVVGSLESIVSFLFASWISKYDSFFCVIHLSKLAKLVEMFVLNI